MFWPKGVTTFVLFCFSYFAEKGSLKQRGVEPESEGGRKRLHRVSEACEATCCPRDCCSMSMLSNTRREIKKATRKTKVSLMDQR